MATAASSVEAVKPKLESIKISQLPQTPLARVECLRSDMTIQDAITFLHERGILAAPVIRAEKADSADWKEKYSGVIDMVHLVVVMLNALEDNAPIPEETSEDLEEEAKGDLRKKLFFHPLSSAFAERPLSDITEEERGYFPFMPIEMDSSLLDAVVLLGNYRLKRLPVLSGPDGDLCNIVTQSSLVQVLASRAEDYKEVTDKTLVELGLAEPTKIHCIRHSQQVKDAFRLIREHNVSAVPVLGVEGEMIGNISARHAYWAITAKNKYRILNMPAAKFLGWAGERESAWNIRNTAITCTSDETLGAVLSKLATAHIHRIYLCDKQNRPYRVLALCDVLKAFGAAPMEQTCTIL